MTMTKIVMMTKSVTKMMTITLGVSWAAKMHAGNVEEGRQCMVKQAGSIRGR